ncbi:hypothetical protein GCM10010191_29050 [Actinomadura vinacea]|uniref:Protein kinase domain-containing protein n=1 Tax=Actinomadura vinacea TaxID=115336 RepID=A0ABN3IXN6_9ACTN
MTLPLTAADPVRLGDYEILARLGTGGQGVVYLGRSLSGTGQVAIKLLHARVLADASSRARFVRELSLLQRVAGFCTAQMLEADMAGDQPYIVSEYVPGPSLRELVHERGPRTGADLDRLAISSVTALTAIHRAGIVHRDFKPQNVLMGPDGPRVIDFGIARALDPDATVTSQIVGTPAYMAPEQFAGAEIGPAADLFAWAATLLFAATGRDPFAGGPLPAVMYRIMHDTPDISMLPEQIGAVAADCFQKDPTARPSAESALLRLLGERSSSHPITRVVPPRQRANPSETEEDRPISGPPGVSGVSGRTTSPWEGRDLGTGRPPPARRSTEWHETAETEEREAEDTREAAAPPGAPDRDAAARDGRERAGPGPELPPAGPPPPAPTGRDAPPPFAGRPGAGHPGAAYPDVRPEGKRGKAERKRREPRGERPLRRLPRSPSVVIGLLLATLLAGVDVFTLAGQVAYPQLSQRPNTELFPLITAFFTLLAIVTLVGVVLAVRGSRAAAWTVLAMRVARASVWVALSWGGVVIAKPSVLVGYAMLTGLVVIFLMKGLRSR